VVILLLVIFRMVFLWIFIAISPVAYVTNIIDSTQKYAQKWWNMYIKLVLFGPMLAFFFVVRSDVYVRRLRRLAGRRS
ncbi:MAG: hypothetical protein HY564_00990, partial [Candidatus Jacksonbacteria bacterium]|nr:hypothetical protein [Candidatus Jacksonbacteria bacterium]